MDFHTVTIKSRGRFIIPAKIFKAIDKSKALSCEVIFEDGSALCLFDFLSRKYPNRLTMPHYEALDLKSNTFTISFDKSANQLTMTQI